MNNNKKREIYIFDFDKNERIFKIRIRMFMES